MNKQTVMKLINKGESSTLEFKTGKCKDFTNIIRVMCAFANTKGGHLLIGVSDNGEIVGCESHYISAIKSRIQRENDNPNAIIPTIKLQIEIIDIDSKSILCISVDKSDQTHTYKGIALYRINDMTVSREAATAYKKINRSGVYNFLMHDDSSQISSYQAAFRILEPFKEWVEMHKGWQMIQEFPSASREKDIQRLIDLKGRDYCINNNIDMSFEANEGPGALDLKLSRGNDKTVIEIKLSTNDQYLHGFEVQIEEYAKAENTRNRIYVYIQLGNPIRTKRIKELYDNKMAAGDDPPFLFVIDSQPRQSASKK